MKKIAARALCMAMMLACGSQPVSAQPASFLRAFYDYLYMPEGRRTTAPFAYTRFCVLNPDDCGRSEQVSVNRASIWHIVRSTNTSVNRSMRPVNDVRERWTAGGRTGDCEDFALTKRRELIRRGVPAAVLRMATATTPRGEGHAVLIVKTTSGDFVLDNRTDRIARWHQTDLKWQRIASADNPRVWHVIN